VISDFLIPGTDGIQLLETAAKLQPEATRILLTGYGDSRRIRRAVRGLGLHYLEKPWNNSELLTIIQSTLPKSVGDEAR
jgi:DNA-binding NtrC family response regulator